MIIGSKILFVAAVLLPAPPLDPCDKTDQTVRSWCVETYHIPPNWKLRKKGWEMLK